MRKLLLKTVLVMMLICSLVACNKKDTKDAQQSTNKTVEKKPSLDTTSYNNFNLEESTLIEDYKVALLSQTDEKNNIYTSAQTGLQRLKDRLDCEIVFEEYTEDDFSDKVSSLIDSDCKMIWVLGDKASDINTVAVEYPEVNFAVVDEYYEEIEDNVILINIKMAEASFLLGYVAGLATNTNVVAIEYVKDNTSDEYVYGFKAGVDYSARETRKEIAVEIVEIADATNIEDVKAQTTALYDKNCDVVYAANKDIESAVAETTMNTDKMVILLSESMSLLAPNNTLTYPVKYVDSAVELVSFHAMSGNDIAGVAYEYGISEGALDISNNYVNVSSVIDSQIGSLKELIIGGAFVIPSDEVSYQEYLASFE